MIEDFEDTNNGTDDLHSSSSTAESKEQTSVEALSSLSAMHGARQNARVAANSSVVSNVPSCVWPHDPLLQIQRRGSIPDMGLSSRRESMGLSVGLGGDLSFPTSRRSSFALGLDLNMAEQTLSSANAAALASQTQSLPSMSHGLGSAASAQLQLSALQASGDLFSQQQQLLQLQQQQQQQQLRRQQLQQQALGGLQRSSDAMRVQAEAQAAAAALFLGAPMPGSDDSSPTSNTLLGMNDSLLAGRPGTQQLLNSSRLGAGARAQHLPSFAGLGALPAPNALPTSQQLLHQASSSSAATDLNLGLPSSNSATNRTGNASLDTLLPTNSMSQLQQLQQQLQQQEQRLQNLQSSFRGNPTTPSQQQRQQKQLEQLQMQGQLQRQQEALRRDSLGLSLGFDSIGSQHPDPSLSARIMQLERQSGNTLSPTHLAELSMKKAQPTQLLSDSSKKVKASEGIPDALSPKASSGNTTSKKDAAFPLKLHEILSNPEYQEMIAWMPHGRSWRILKPSAFENLVIPVHFRHSKYASFMRQVNGWGFQRILHGNDHNSYRHDLFIRDRPDLCKKMKRVGTVKKAKEGAGAKSDEKAQSKANVGQGETQDEDGLATFPEQEETTSSLTESLLATASSPTMQSRSKMQSLSKIPTGVSALARPEGVASLHDFGGNDVNAISAARSALSDKFALSVGAHGPNQWNNNFGQMFQDASSSEMPSSLPMGLGQLDTRQMEQLLKLSPPHQLTNKLATQPHTQQLQHSQRLATRPIEGIDVLQQRLGSTGGFSVDLLAGGGGMQLGGGPSRNQFSSAQVQAALASRTEAGSARLKDASEESDDHKKWR
ncbi:shock factor protein 4 [Seminavis robusta]|uniref:Shock factor protein 4 n=1 Tax=Seminavis robusta TaxID=568900 RepID=A0A9N8EI53_9STRA|nr:shock factor protein 4 [Seminavis robusta]|eukprot:Sro1262_g257120.1 shock factor protein 4 (831) ;mRNA; r:10549-13286